MANTVVKQFRGNTTITIPGGVYKLNVQTVKNYLAGTAHGDGETAFSSRGFIDVFGRGFSMGSNAVGQNGTGNQTPTSSPTLVAGGLDWRKIIGCGSIYTATRSSSLGVTSTGVAYGWGDNVNGQLGTGNITTVSSPTLVAGGLVFQDIFQGPEQVQSFGLTPGGTLYAWGGGSPSLGINSITSVSSPVAVSGGLNIRRFTIQGGDALNGACCSAITSSGSLYTWGVNNIGQLGDGTTVSKSSPVQVVGGLSFQKVVIAADPFGTTFTSMCGLTTSGQAYCWGSNIIGSCGDGTITNRSSPVAVVGGLVFQDIFGFNAQLEGTFFALDYKNQLWSWGSDANSQGILGNGASGSKSSPVLVVGGLQWDSIAGTINSFSGDAIIYGLTKNGTLYAWGSDLIGAPSGLIGNGTSGNAYSSPVAVLGGLQVKALNVCSGSLTSGAESAAYALTVGGQIYAWGQNQSGGLGTNDVVPRSSPTLMVGGLAGKSLPITTSYQIPVVPGTTYNVQFGPWGAAIGNQVVGQNNIDLMIVSYDE
jgi:alpha-tubulin suppressor-like RCC1 family protein